MKVILAEHAGFCAGVRSAFENALELAEKYGKIYTAGELIHNENVVDFLQSKGVFALPIEKLSNLKEGDTVLIRAHGIPIEVEAAMRVRGVRVFDATCPVVKKIHRIVEERSAMGEDVIIIGDRNHDEVTGTASRAGENVAVYAVNDTPVFTSKPTAVVFQTTVPHRKYEQICALYENYKKTDNNLVGFFNTICYTTTVRQEEAKRLAAQSDAVLVLGSRKSANTVRLYEAASAVNPDTYFAESRAEACEQLKNKDFQCISVVAGASTPPWLIQEVTKFMSETQMNAAEQAAIEAEANKEATLRENTKASETAEKELTMEDVIASNRSVGYTNYRAGKRIKGTVIRADESGIFVAVGGKKDGFIDKADAALDDNYNPADFKAGDPIEAVIINATNKEYVSLSKKEVDQLKAEEAEAEKALAAGEFSLVMTEVVKGGLRGRMGPYTVFVPASQIRMGYVKNLEDYKGKTLRLVLMPPKEKEVVKTTEVAEGAEIADVEGVETALAENDTEAAPVEEAVKETVSEAAASDKPAKRSKYLFASQRMVLEREKKEKEDEFWESIHVHDIVIGKVKRFTAFGAFVNVRGFDCLAHISELSWNKITDPASVLKIGESYDFVVLKMDRESGKISLGFKQLQKKPYEIAAEQYPVGTVIKGRVERIFPYGAFISITDGVDGLVHVSQISHNWIKDANEALKVGEEVEAKIIGFEENRITLSIKDLLPAPDEMASQEEENEAETDKGEDKPKRQSRIKKFEQKLAEGEAKRDRRPSRRDSSNEPKEWVTGAGSATLGDLFKNLNLNIEEEEAPAAEVAEEAPKKATRKKKAVAEEAPSENE